MAKSQSTVAARQGDTVVRICVDHAGRPLPACLARLARCSWCLIDLKAIAGCGAQTANVIIYLTDIAADAGGETVLLAEACALDGMGCPIRIRPKRGKVVIWRSYDDEGLLDPRAMHTAHAVRGSSEKILLAMSLRRSI